MVHQLIAVAGLLLIAADGEPKKKHEGPASKEGNLVVGLCDGETSVEVKGKKPGQQLTKGEGQKIAADLMGEWLKKNPDKKWESGVLVAQSGTSGAKQAPAEKKENIQSGHTYGAFD